MIDILILLQKILILAYALEAVIFSDDLGSALDTIRRNAMCSKRSRGAIIAARDLLSCRQDLEDNVKSIIGESYYALHQMKLLRAGVNDQKNFVSDKIINNVKAYYLSETKKYGLEVKNNLIMNHVFIDEEFKGRILDCVEIQRDEKASNTLDAVSLYIATLNVTCSLVEKMKEYLNAVKKVKNLESSYAQLSLYVKNVMWARDIAFVKLALLWKTSRYTFNPKAILFSKDYFEEFILPDIFEFVDEPESDSTFEILPSSIIFREMDGTLRELVY